MRLIRSSAGLCMMLLAFSVHTETMAAPFVPGSPCNGCTVEIFDHTGVLRTAKNAVFRVSNPQTPNGPAPFLELYNPTLAMIEDCAAKVDSIRKPAPGSVVMNAREYQLSGSNQVVFLIEDCEGGGGPGSGEGGPIDEQDDPSLGPPDDGSGLGCAGSGDVPASTSCSVSGGGWQTVTHTLSEANCNLGHTDSVSGSGQLVLYDNTYTVMCDEGNYTPDVYVGETAADSNWGAYTTHNETCKMKTGPRPSDGTRVIETIVCPAPDDGHRDDGDGRHDDHEDCPECEKVGTCFDADGSAERCCSIIQDNETRKQCMKVDACLDDGGSPERCCSAIQHAGLRHTCLRGGDEQRDDHGGDGRHDDHEDCPECGEVGACFEKGGSPERCCSIFPDDERRKECMRRSDGRHDDRGDDGRQDDRGDEGQYDPTGEPSNYARMYGCGPMVDGRAYSPTYFSSPDLPDYQADGTCNGNHPQDGTANRTCKLKIAHFDSTNSPTLQSGQGASTYTMYGVELVGQPSTVQQPLTLRLNYAFTDVSGAQGGIADSLSNYSPDSVVDCLGALDDATTPREGWIIVEDDDSGELRILHTPMLFLEF